MNEVELAHARQARMDELRGLWTKNVCMGGIEDTFYFARNWWDYFGIGDEPDWFAKCRKAIELTREHEKANKV